jgi:hypothetical protein
MSNGWYHCIWVLVLGYIIGYYFRGLGNATVGKLYPSS